MRRNARTDPQDWDFALARYNADGSLDATFGSGGKVTTALGYNDTATDVAIQEDGKIVVGGFTLACSTFDDFVVYDEEFQRQPVDATHIDRLNLGPVPTIQLDWLQPHEGNIVEFLFRPRAFQARLEKVAV